MVDSYLVVVLVVVVVVVVEKGFPLCLVRINDRVLVILKEKE